MPYNLIPTKPTTNVAHMSGSMLQVSLVPFEQVDTPTYKKDKVLTFKLCMELDKESSATYEISVPFFKHGTAEKIFIFMWNCQKSYGRPECDQCS